MDQRDYVVITKCHYNKTKHKTYKIDIVLTFTDVEEICNLCLLPCSENCICRLHSFLSKSQMNCTFSDDAS